MKRAIALLLCLLLVLTGCTAGAGESAAPAETEPQPTEQVSDPSEEASEPAEESQPEETEEPAEASGLAQVDIRERSESVTAEDGTEVQSIRTVNITVTVPGKPEVEESISADLRRLLETSAQAEQELTAGAQEAYAGVKGTDESWYPYESALQVEVTRCDERVLSLRFDAYQYTGGIHGYGYAYGRSYDLASGSRITLDFMSDRSVSFPDEAAWRVLELCQSEEYADGLFPDYEEYIGDVVNDQYFYLGEDGVVFLANPYVISSYADGILEFTLEYDSLEGVVKAEYLA